MKTATSCAMLLLPLVLSATGAGQESDRRLDRPGQFTKYLTPGQLDNWIIQGEKGETIIAHVATNEFDPVLELASKQGNEDRVMIQADDEGSESRFAIRLPRQGEFKIRVHAFKYQGGGNYSLRVRRFQASPVSVGKPLVGAFDRHGKGYHYFQGEQGQILIPKLEGASTRGVELLDLKGRGMRNWSGAALVEKSGQHYLVLSGAPGDRYQLDINAARQRGLQVGQKPKGRLERREMDVWTFQGKPGDFRLLAADAQGRTASRLIYSPGEERETRTISLAERRPEIQFIPVGGKGGRLRIAAVLGREGQYQLQLMAQTKSAYDLQMLDPTKPLGLDEKAEGSLPLGGDAFYSFQATPGQLLKASLVSKTFDPMLRLYDSRGRLIRENDDGEDGVGSRITYMVAKADQYRLHAASLGNGGSGKYVLELEEMPLEKLKVGGRGQGTLAPGGTDYWTFDGQEGKTMLLHVRSEECDPIVVVKGPDGVQLGSDDNGGVGSDSLLAVRLPKTGRYTAWISSKSGAGNYSLRLMDGD